MKNIFITKTDLAMAYFPYIGERAARHKLMELINNDSTLMQQLTASGYKRLTHTFSPRQVEMIFEVFGNPFKGAPT